MQKILIVENRPDDMETLVHLVSEEKGWKVIEAKDAGEAIRAMDADQFDAAIVDLRLMPGDTDPPGEEAGLDVLRALVSKMPRTQVIMLTAYPDAHSAVKAMRMGAFDYVDKDDMDRGALEVLRFRIRKALDYSNLLSAKGA
jgi:DNA-binding NtrC family response regulator